MNRWTEGARQSEKLNQLREFVPQGREVRLEQASADIVIGPKFR